MSHTVVVAASTFRGEVRVPGDKSASHRALLLSALADGTSTITGLSPGHDVQATSAILQQLGAQRRDEAGLVSIMGPPDGLQACSVPLDCGNSGTTIRLLSGVLSAISGQHTLVGDASLSKRPMDRVATPLREMGAMISGRGERVLPPLIIEGKPLTGIVYDVPVPSAQVKSAVMLAGLFASGATTVNEAVRTRTTTEEMLAACGVSLTRENVGEGRSITIQPSRPHRHQWRIPSDPSQAAFFCVLGLIHQDAVIRIMDVEGSAERTGFMRVLERMGGTIDLRTDGSMMNVVVRSSELVATEIRSQEIPSVDEAPILTVAAAAASGTSVFRDMGELRLKESDRFEGCLVLARSVGARAWSDGDDFFVEGLGSATKFEPFTSEAGLDHRIVMSSAVAGLAGHGCTIEGSDTVASSYPHFFDDVRSLQ